MRALAAVLAIGGRWLATGPPAWLDAPCPPAGVPGDGSDAKIAGLPTFRRHAVRGQISLAASWAAYALAHIVQQAVRGAFSSGFTHGCRGFTLALKACACGQLWPRTHSRTSCSRPVRGEETSGLW